MPNYEERREWLRIKKFMVPLDIVTLTSEEVENKSSVIAGYVRKGKVIPAT